MEYLSVRQAMEKWHMTDRRVTALCREGRIPGAKKTGKTWLKVVNALPAELSLSLKGMTVPAGAKIEGFEGAPASEKAKVVSTTANGELKLPPYSFRVVEVK